MGGLSLRRVSLEANAAWQATYWGCDSPSARKERRWSVLALAFVISPLAPYYLLLSFIFDLGHTEGKSGRTHRYASLRWRTSTTVTTFAL